jgi:hypothetical protein
MRIVREQPLKPTTAMPTNTQRVKRAVKVMDFPPIDLAREST